MVSHSSEGGLGVVLGASGEMTPPVGGSAPSALALTTDDAANAVGTAVDDEAIAKWTVWAIGNMVGKYHRHNPSPSSHPLPPFLLHLYISATW